MKMSGAPTVSPNTAFTLSERLCAEDRVPPNYRLHKPGHRIPWPDLDEVTRWVGIRRRTAPACSEAASPPCSSPKRVLTRRRPRRRSFNPRGKALSPKFARTPDGHIETYRLSAPVEVFDVCRVWARTARKVHLLVLVLQERWDRQFTRLHTR